MPEHGRLGLDRVADDDVELGAVAGGEDDRLADLRVGGELAQERLGARLGQRDALAHRQRRGLVRRAEQQQLAHTRSSSGSRAASRRSTISDSSVISRSIRTSFVAMIAT